MFKNYSTFALVLAEMNFTSNFGGMLAEGSQKYKDTKTHDLPYLASQP